MVGLEASIVVDVGRHDANQRIAVSEHYVAFEHLGQPSHLGNEVVDGVLVLGAQPDAREERLALADPGRVENGHVAIDHAGIFQQPYAAQTGRRRQPDLTGELVVRHPSVALESPQNALVDLVEDDWHPKLPYAQ